MATLSSQFKHLTGHYSHTNFLYTINGEFIKFVIEKSLSVIPYALDIQEALYIYVYCNLYTYRMVNSPHKDAKNWIT